MNTSVLNSVVHPRSVPRKAGVAADDEVHVITQFFLPKERDTNLSEQDLTRRSELRETLSINLQNLAISRIHLLNERVYTPTELGLEEFQNKYPTLDLAKRLVQVVIGKRLTYKDALEYVQRKGELKGYIVITNSDIFFDKTVSNLHLSTLDEERAVITQLRYEYRKRPADTFMMRQPDQSRYTVKIHGPNMYSQDTWILHTNQMISPDMNEVFDVPFGKPGCDNKVAYLFQILNYALYNDPSFVKTYHHHSSVSRDYSAKDTIPSPYTMVCPAGYFPASSLQEISFDDNNILHSYLEEKLLSGVPFIIPRVAGEENNFALMSEMAAHGKIPLEQSRSSLKTRYHIMKKNAGIQLSSEASCSLYSDLYLKAFENCEMFSGWETNGRVYKAIKFSQDRLLEILNVQKGDVCPAATSKKMIWAFALDIFHYIHHPAPWTHALRGKRVLVISCFADLIRSQWEVRDKLWGSTGVDLFPGCTLEVFRPPMTQGDEESKEFDEELASFCSRLDSEMTGKYDVALVSCGGYGNLVCNHIFEKHQRSAIYVGGVLQMFFGILGNRWVSERPDIVKLYQNEFWIRPGTESKPKGFEKIETSCYW